MKSTADLAVEAGLALNKEELTRDMHRRLRHFRDLVEDDLIGRVLACYSPDDSQRDWEQKIRSLAT